ncbi:hypothetical protein JKF63_04698 [Porcisia hertigi]|uniref:Uncharacterized protein n=1 Tax=Porcisia hertigi TaxID=2761500 RepID=A0A836LC64_9TRYP|nr:hypothetical protein JKF63_04698 [Porcisia hertigi]
MAAAAAAAAGGSHTVKAVAALRLQRDRSTTYQHWTSLFHRAITGDITATELQHNIQGIILPEFQRISTQLRQLQAELTETADKTEQPQNSTASPSNAEESADPADIKCRTSSALLSASSFASSAMALAAWIDRLQELEREHYAVTLSLANQLVEHCTPNVCLESESGSLKTAEGVQTVSETTKAEMPRRRRRSTGIRSLFKPGSSDDDEPCELVKEPSARIAQSPPVPSAPGPGPTMPTLRVHDVERCALYRLIPPRYYTHLHFVACRCSLEDVGSTSGHSANRKDDRVGEKNASVDTELVALPATDAGKGGVSIIARYAPSDVSSRCADWSGAVAAIVHRQEWLRAAIEELCEELQAEISDDA